MSSPGAGARRSIQMISFLAGFALSGGALFVWNWTQSSEGADDRVLESTSRLAMLFLIFPVFGAWLALRIAHYLRPTALVSSTNYVTVASIVRGVVAGLVSSVLAVCSTPLLDRFLSDILIMISSAICGTIT